MLDDRRAGFHPVAGVEVAQARDLAVGRVVDVAADHPVRALAPRLLGEEFLELADEVDGVLDLHLGPGRERPVGQAQPAADLVEARVDEQREGVGPVAQMGEPAGVAHHHVELVAVDHEVAPAVRALVDAALGDLDAAEGGADVVAQELVVVARHVDEVRALAHLAQELLHHVVVRLRPVPARAQLPPVDDVADEVDRVRVVVLQEIEQEGGLAALRPEMQIGQEQRSDADGLRVFTHARLPQMAGGAKPQTHLSLMTLCRLRASVMPVFAQVGMVRCSRKPSIAVAVALRCKANFFSGATKFFRFSFRDLGGHNRVRAEERHGPVPGRRGDDGRLREQDSPRKVLETAPSACGAHAAVAWRARSFGGDRHAGMPRPRAARGRPAAPSTTDRPIRTRPGLPDANSLPT